jgi:hypothetical protein
MVLPQPRGPASPGELRFAVGVAKMPFTTLMCTKMPFTTLSVI